ncbi:MAG: SH3 domain-containing protein [Treponema sp.]|jgi:hypothetical protein|nr:SH3 domain-containing protein [Treponema sp.]
MKIIYILLILFGIPSLVYAQNIDKSIYQEISLIEAYENRQNSSERVYHYKSIVHFEFIITNNHMGNMNVLFYQNSEFINLYHYYSFNIPKMERFQIVIIYYRFVREGTAFRNILDHIELIELINAPFFIIGDHYRTLDNLRLRSEANLSGNIIFTIQRREWVIILEEGNVETIDGITSAWVKVKLVGGNKEGIEGWCFGGYLGYYDR